MRKMRRFSGIALLVLVIAMFGATVAFTAAPGAIEDAVNHFGNRNGEGRIGDGVIDREALKEVVANALNMTVAELDAAHEAGQRLPEIAEAQGVDIADVQAAVEAARAEMIEEALAAGLITEEQAELMLSREGGFGSPGGRRGGHGPRILDRDIVSQTVADALGITVEELGAAHESGQTLTELADELGVDIADVEAAVQAAFEEALDQAVVDGLITTEQADQIRERMANGEGFGLGGPRGGRGHGDHGGRCGGGPGNGDDGVTEPTGLNT